MKALVHHSTYTPGGRNNDCAVRATAVALFISYDEAEEKARVQMGRKSLFSGTPYDGICRFYGARAIAKRFYKYRWTLDGRLFRVKEPEVVTVRMFARRNPIGRWFLLVNGHAVAMVDGELYDNAHPSWNCHVHMAWRVK